MELEIPLKYKHLYEDNTVIRKYPSEILRTKCDDVLIINAKTKQLISKMIHIIKSHSAVGLAANQIGVRQNIIVINTGDKPMEFINPQIISVGGPVIEDVEQCLSLPFLEAIVPCYDKISIRAKNKHGKDFSIVLSGLSARVAQHEINHIKGELFFDKAVPGTLKWK